MQLTDRQISSLNDQGFLMLPDLFSSEEVERLRNRLPALFADGHEGNLIERAAGEVRTAMGLHLRDTRYAALVRHPRLVEPALQILETPVYVQQVKVNVKAAFSGEGWQWHYDFATHHKEVGVP